MADTISISEVPYTEIKRAYPYWDRYPIVKRLYEKGKKPSIIHIDVNIDTSGAALTEFTTPSNVIYDFTTPKQVYIRSDNALDVSKDIYLLGQKADGSIGTFKFTTNAADGTTAVDCGTWNYILIPNDLATCAGNLIVDNDGVSGTVYWTIATGTQATTGIIVIPEGYHGAFVTGFSTLLADPGSAGEGMHLDAGDIKSYLSRNNPDAILMNKIGEPIPEKGRISLKSKYEVAAVTLTFLHILLVAWEA